MQKIYNLHISNFLAIKEMDLDLSAGITGIVGPNAAGKTSVIKAIAGILDGSHDIRKIKDGEERSEIRLEELTVDGETIRSVSRIQTLKGSTLKGKNLPRAFTPKKYIEELLDEMAINPLRLIEDDPVKYLKKHMPAKALPEDIEGMIREEMPFDIERNGFDECDKQVEYFGAVRRKTYGEVRHAQEVVEELKQELPQLPDIAPAFTMDQYQSERDKIISEEATIEMHNENRASVLQKIEDTEDELRSIEHSKKIFDLAIKDHIFALQKSEEKLIEDIEKLKRTQENFAKETKHKIELNQQKIEQFEEKAKEENKSLFDLNEELETLPEKSVSEIETRRIQLEAKKNEIEEYHKLLKRHEQLSEKERIYLDKKEWYDMEDSLYKYYAYELPKMLIERSKIPVEGVEFRDNDLYVNGRHIKLMAASEQALTVSKIVAYLCKQRGQCCVTLDGLEILDEEHKKEFLDAMENAGLRVIYTRHGQIENKYERDVREFT